MAPRAFSIVVPVHNVRAYLRECLDSVLTQSFTDFELIAVDDASPDGSGEILDDYALADARVSVLHLTRNVGLGRARDAGVDMASGRYLLFLDGDDTLTPGALDAIARRLADSGDPDILVFDYARTYWDGTVERNILARLFAEPGPDVFSIDDRPDLLTLLMVVWNKGYRLDFVREHGFRFPEGFYEDLPWTYPTMLTASRIAILDRVCYHYRQRRHGNILRSTSRRHLDIFGQYDRVFAYLDAHPELRRWQPFMFDRMVTHLLQIIKNRRRVAGTHKREFFDAFADAYARHRPSDYVLPKGRKGVKLRALARRDWVRFEVADATVRAQNVAKSDLRKAKRRARTTAIKCKRALIQTFYRAERRKPIDPSLAIYSAYWSTDYSCNPAAIYEKAKELAPDIRGVWVIRRDAVDRMPAGVEYVELYSPEYYRVMATAKYFVNNVNFADNIVKRPGTVHVQTQHGTPLKSMGLGQLDHPGSASGMNVGQMNFAKLMKRCDRWDYLISSNRFSSEVWERSFPNSYVTLEVGYPRNDRLVRATSNEVAALRERFELPAGRTVVLYAPTFRDWIRGRFEPPLDLADLAERLGDDFVLLVRGHYLTDGDDRLARLADRGLLRDVSSHQSIEDLLLVSDVLVTDYSSVMFDYANLDRPIVIHAPDWDTYRQVRGVNYDLLAEPPGVVTTTQDEMVDALRAGRFRDDAAEALRKEFAHRFCDLDDGHAAERVVQRVLLGGSLRGDAYAQPATGIAQDEAGPQADDEDEPPSMPDDLGEREGLDAD